MGSRGRLIASQSFRIDAIGIIRADATFTLAGARCSEVFIKKKREREREESREKEKGEEILEEEKHLRNVLRSSFRVILRGVLLKPHQAKAKQEQNTRVGPTDYLIEQSKEKN